MRCDPLYGLLPDDLCAALAERGHACSTAEARRVLAWVVSAGAATLDGMARPVRRDLRAAISTGFSFDLPREIERVEDPTDRSVRFVFRLRDGAVAEAVRIPLHKPGRFSVCLSSQAGCAMQCDFCATGRLGLTRNLTTAEMVGTWLAVRATAQAEGGRVTGAVFMGQGEPFHNYDAVIQAAEVLRHPCGGRISAKAITISTVGLVPQIRRFTREGHKFRLVVSLTSAVPARRHALLPVAGRFPLDELADALREYHGATGRRVTLAWVLMGGVNTGQDEVDALQARFGDLPIRLNLIDVNDPRPGGYRRATEAERGALRDALQVMEIPVVRRYSVGQGQASACGMLATRHAADAGLRRRAP